MRNGLAKNLLKRIKLNESAISTILGGLVVVVIGMLVFNYFRGVGVSDKSEELATEEINNGSEPIELVEEKGELLPANLPAKHTVKKGEHLWSIAEKYYGSGYNWVDIARENNLSNPNALLVDQELSIPKSAVIDPQSDNRDPVVAGAFDDSIDKEQYTVVDGDHLWGIAIRTYGDGYQWVKIAQTNNLDNPGLIHPGNVLTLPR